MIDRLTDLAESQGSNMNENDDNKNDISSWQVLENSLMDDMFSCENPYVQRKVGVSNRHEEHETRYDRHSYNMEL